MAWRWVQLGCGRATLYHRPGRADLDLFVAEARACGRPYVLVTLLSEKEGGAQVGATLEAAVASSGERPPPSDGDLESMRSGRQGVARGRKARQKAQRGGGRGSRGGRGDGGGAADRPAQDGAADPSKGKGEEGEEPKEESGGICCAATTTTTTTTAITSVSSVSSTAVASCGSEPPGGEIESRNAEVPRADGAKEASVCARAQVEWLWHPLQNSMPPEPGSPLEAFVVLLSEKIDAGNSVMIHCSAGIHRTGMCAYALLRLRGRSPDEALTSLADMRIQTKDGIQARHLEWGDAFIARRLGKPPPSSIPTSLTDTTTQESPDNAPSKTEPNNDP
ncbi:hypothetical protein Pelo_16434 [Pelomyxa schiedti]|nr:hypothetical protein Pelo_16434 [Pelomyxa schiedti]